MTNKVRSPRSHSLKAQTVSPDAIVLDAYFGRHVAPEVLLDAYEQLRIRDEPSDYTRLQAAVAAVLLRSIRHLLPAHSSTFDSDNRRRRPRQLESTRVQTSRAVRNQLGRLGSGGKRSQFNAFNADLAGFGWSLDRSF